MIDHRWWSFVVVGVVCSVFFCSGAWHGVQADADFYNSNDVFLHATPDSCRPNEHFDISGMKCAQCDDSLMLIPSRDKLSCTCNDQSLPVRDHDSVLQRPLCRNVSEFFLQPPGITTRFDSINFCKLSHVDYVNSSKSFRTVYVQRKMFPPGNESTVCGCNERTAAVVLYSEREPLPTESGNYCLPQALLRDVQHYPPFGPNRQLHQNRQNVNVYRNIKYLIVFCHVIRSMRHCQQLANLCVLSFYSLDRYSPCAIFYTYQTYDVASMGGAAAGGGSIPSVVSASQSYMAAVREIGTGKLATVEGVRPGLFYRRGKYASELFEKYLDFSYDSNATNRINNTLNFTYASYDLYGHLVRFQDMHFADLNLCERYAASQEQRIRFGQTYDRKCHLNVNRLVEDFREPEFVTLYVSYYESKARLLRPVPVLVGKAFSHNHDADPEKWQLVKRFLLVDTVSGLNEVHRRKLYSPAPLGEKFFFVRYARRVHMEFKLHPNHDKYPNRIAIPLLHIEYGLLNFSHWNQAFYGKTVEFDFKISFTKSYSYSSLLEILLPILILLAFSITIFETYCYKLRQNKFYYDMEIFGNFLIQLCSNLATAFLGISLIIALHTFFTYKTQTTIQLLLPVEIQNLVETFVYAALVFKLLKLMRMFFQMANIDIFFIDWERPKIFDIGLAAQRQQQLDTPSIASSTNTRTNSHDSVSAWRNYFIANEWQELATKRKISMFAHVILLVLLFMVFGFHHWSSNSFGIHLLTNHEYLGDPDKMLLMAVGILIYSAVYFGQRLYNFLIYNRFVENAIQQFIDVASIANISVFILSAELYGFYIHGRSPHGFSDTDMCSMILQFKREEDNLCGNRGLLPGSEQQTYSILVPTNLRTFYDKLITPLRNSSSFGPHQHLNQPQLISSAKLSSSEVFASPGGGRIEYNFERTILTYYNINRFFAAFIDHALKDLDYIIQEKTILESLTNCEFQSYVTENKGVFYIDNGHSFDQVLFYGNESTFFQLELLLFTTVVLLSGNYLLAILVVGIVFKCFEVVMNHALKNNLAKKTLIDKRFLI